MKQYLKKILPTHLNLSPKMLDQMDDHWDLLLEWNERVNLTAILDPRDAAHLHYLDSLAAIEHGLEGPVVDMGSGGASRHSAGHRNAEGPIHFGGAPSKAGLFLANSDQPPWSEKRQDRDGQSRARHKAEPFRSLVTRATFSDDKALRSRCAVD